MYVHVQAVLIIIAKLIKCSLSRILSLFSSLFVSILSTTFPLFPPSLSFLRVYLLSLSSPTARENRYPNEFVSDDEPDGDADQAFDNFSSTAPRMYLNESFR